MADDFVVPVVAGMLAADISNGAQNKQMMHDMALQQRAQSIGDMFGARPPSFEEYREKTGQKTGFGKALVYAAVGAVIAVAIAGAATALIGGMAAIEAATLAPVAGTALLGALLGGTHSASKDRQNAMANYEGYMSDFANKARIAHDSQLRQQVAAPAQEVPAKDVASTKDWSATVADQRNQPAQQMGK